MEREDLAEPDPPLAQDLHGPGAIAAAGYSGGGKSRQGWRAPRDPGPDMGKLTTGDSARAKRVIDIHMKGAVSRSTLSSYKPRSSNARPEIPPSVKGTAKVSAMSNAQSSFR